MEGDAYKTAGTDCGYPASSTDCADVWGQVKGLLSSGRPHQSPVNTATTCGKITYNGAAVPWVSPNTENLLMHYCWHTEKISAVDEDHDTFFGRQVHLNPPQPPLPSRTNWTRLVPLPVLTGHVSSQVHLSKCDIYLGAGSTCLIVTRGKLYADELYVYARTKPGCVLPPPLVLNGHAASLTRTKWTRRVPHPVLIGHAGRATGTCWRRVRRPLGRGRGTPRGNSGTGASSRTSGRSTASTATPTTSARRRTTAASCRRRPAPPAAPAAGVNTRVPKELPFPHPSEIDECHFTCDEPAPLDAPTPFEP